MVMAKLMVFGVYVYIISYANEAFKISTYIQDLHMTSDVDTYLTIPKIIRKYGYPSEEHVVQTEDGYLLGIHRIPHGKSIAMNRSDPILFHHGVLSSSLDWVVNGPNKSLGYRLADAGYDVWMANSRGNTYSRSHISKNPNDPSFWEFTMHEIGIYDLPAVIDYILKTTGKKQVIFIGHSMGTTVFYILTSMRPEYNEKVKFHVGLAPVAFLSHTQSLCKYFAPYADKIMSMMSWYGKGAFLEHDLMTKVVSKMLCSKDLFDRNLCEQYIIFTLCGKDPKQFDPTLFPMTLAHFPAGTSSKTLVHFAQLIKSGKFQLFDYGPTGNIKHYNSSVTPQYDITKITIPAALYYGPNDILADPTDVHIFYNKLTNPISLTEVAYAQFNHIDFLWSIDINPLLNDHVLKLINDTEDPTFIKKKVELSLKERLQFHLTFPEEKKKKPVNDMDDEIPRWTNLSLPDIIPTVTKHKIDRAFNDIQGGIQDVKVKVKSGIQHAKNRIESVMQVAKENVESDMENIKNKGIETMKTASEIVGEAIDETQKTMKDSSLFLTKKVKNTFDNVHIYL